MALTEPSVAGSYVENQFDVVSDESDNLETPLQVWEALCSSLKQTKAATDSVMRLDVDTRKDAAPRSETSSAWEPTSSTQRKSKRRKVPVRGEARSSESDVAKKSHSTHSPRIELSLRPKAHKRTRKHQPSRRAAAVWKELSTEEDLEIDESTPPNDHHSLRRSSRRASKRIRSKVGARHEKQVRGKIDFIDSQKANEKNVAARPGTSLDDDDETPDFLLDTPDLAPDANPKVATEMGDNSSVSNGTNPDSSRSSSPDRPPCNSSRSSADDTKKTALDELFFAPSRMSPKKPPPRSSLRKKVESQTDELVAENEDATQEKSCGSMLDDDSLWGGRR